VHVLFKRKPQRLHRAGLEVLAIIAYRQPVTRPEIDDIRGVDSSNTLRQLLERNLIRILGKSDEVGRPLIYGTTSEFLAFFGMQNLAELPTLREFTELTEEHMVKLQALDQTLNANTQTVLPLDPNGLAGIALGAVPAGERAPYQPDLDPTADNPTEGGDHLEEEPRG
jgi:segregation and condensation protein B